MSRRARAHADTAPSRDSEGAASLLGIAVRNGRVRRFAEGAPASSAHEIAAAGGPEPEGAAMAAPQGPPPKPATPMPAAAPASQVVRAAQPAPPSASISAPPSTPPSGLPAGLAGRPAPVAGALLAQWRGWRNGGRLPSLSKAEGRMAALCPGGVLLAVDGSRVEVAQRLPGEAPPVDLAALEWMRTVARQAARHAVARHELDEEAGLGLVVLPFALEGDGSAAAAAVLCRLYSLQVAAADPAPPPANRGLFSGVWRRLAGA